MRIRHRSRITALAATVALVATLIPAPLAGAAVDPDAASAAADWIAAELDQAEPDFDQFGKAGPRTDVVAALASLQARPGSVRQAMSELAGVAADYIGTPDAPNVGALAKVLLAVRITRDDDGALRVVVRDDGVGGAHVGKGHGLAGLRDRLAGVDGTLEVHSPDGGGTVVAATIP